MIERIYDPHIVVAWFIDRKVLAPVEADRSMGCWTSRVRKIPKNCALQTIVDCKVDGDKIMTA
jgi:hypothetical protein